MLLIPARVKFLIDKGRVEGREEANAEWEAWYARYMEAKANGRTFDEPPPTERNGAS